MQMLGTWLVAFQAIRLDGGWCFKGVHLSQVHQQSYQVPNKAVKCTNIPSVVNSSCLVGALETTAPPEESVEK